MPDSQHTMPCEVLRSSSRAYTYLYIPTGSSLEDLPERLRSLFGDAEKIMDLELSAQRPLAQEDVLVVMANLASQGYHLQLPPKHDASGWLDLPSR